MSDFPAELPATTRLIDRPWLRPAMHCVFFAVLMIAAHFWYADQYSLYEDDLACVPLGAIGSFWQVWDRVKLTWEGILFGRPIAWTMMHYLPWVCFQFGNLPVVYYLCSLIVAANGVMFYLLMRRCFNEPIALVAAAAFCLFPADTARQMLIHTTILQPSMLFILIAAHLWLNGKWWQRAIAYFLSLLALLSYESTFLIFLGVPILVRQWNWKRLAISFAIHWAVCGALVGGVLTYRVMGGEQRAVHVTAEGDSAAVRMLKAMYIGPTTSMDQFIDRAKQAIRPNSFLRRGGQFRPGDAIAGGTIAFGALFLLSGLWRRDRRPVGTSLWSIGRAALIGLPMLCGSYVLAITDDHYPPVDTFGRMTSVHLAATFGGSILFACVWLLLMRLADFVRGRIVIVLLLAAHLGALCGFAHIVGKSFVIAKLDQQDYWTNVIKLCPDIGNETMIVMEGQVPTNNWFALGSSWSDALVLPLLYRYPASVEVKPIVGRVGRGDDWKNQFEWRDGKLRSTVSFPAGTGRAVGKPLVEGNTILLRVVDGVYTRVTGEITVHGRPFKLKDAPTGPMTIPYEPGVLYPLFMNDARLPPAMRKGKLPGPLYLAQ